MLKKNIVTKISVDKNSCKRMWTLVVNYRLPMQWTDTFAPTRILCAMTRMARTLHSIGRQTWRPRSTSAASSIRELGVGGSTACRFELVWTLTHTITTWLLLWHTLQTITCTPLCFSLPYWPGTSGTQDQISAISQSAKWWLLNDLFSTQTQPHWQSIYISPVFFISV